MFLYEVNKDTTEEELTEICLDIFQTYLEFGTVGIIQKDNKNN